MDGLPILETTGLDHASTVIANEGHDRPVPVMHACGHDVHLTCLLGAATLLAANRADWAGTVLAVCQPAEETGAGAAAMIADDFFDRFPIPDVCLAQHVGPLPAGLIVTRPGPLMAAADNLRIRLRGHGGHSAIPDRTTNPITVAAGVIQCLSEVANSADRDGGPVVLTVGALHAGTAANVVPDEAELLVSVRTPSGPTRATVLDALNLLVRTQAAISGAEEPDITPLHSFPITVNEPVATNQVVAALRGAGHNVHVLSDMMSASEDFGRFATAAGCPSVFWHFGADTSYTPAELVRLIEDGIPQRIASNHTSGFAPDSDAAIEIGTTALLTAAAAWLAPS
jgi:hippurate hydrolase